MTSSPVFLNYNSAQNIFYLQNHWDVQHYVAIKTAINANTINNSTQKLIISAADLQNLDTAGALLLTEFIQQLEQAHITIHLVNFQEKYLALIKLVNEKNADLASVGSKKSRFGTLEKIGRLTLSQLGHFSHYLNFIGELAIELGRSMREVRTFRLGALSDVIYRNGYLALPIIALLSYLIGVVLTYQMGLQLKAYGANIYVVDLLGLSILREFAPLLTAIMIAGRSGSAFTAELGMMKLNQEIDALNTMGVPPAALLLLPRIIGLIIALPLLIMWADFFGILGGMMMAGNMLNVNGHDFLLRFGEVIPAKSLLIGLGKAPVFAAIIATIGCYQGMQVTGSAESIGRNTTRSVVLAIFYIIVADAVFSIVLSALKL